MELKIRNQVGQVANKQFLSRYIVGTMPLCITTMQINFFKIRNQITYLLNSKNTFLEVFMIFLKTTALQAQNDCWHFGTLLHTRKFVQKNIFFMLNFPDI